ncbi:MAG: VanZ family protein [Clostridiales bacterium]|nr:VanZ family protein [Clostridiales bacterium]
MREKSKKQIVCLCVSWFVVALILAAVFYLSSQPADESAALSRFFEIRISRFFSIKLSDFTVRKLAHATEYFILACAVFNALYVTFEKKKPAVTFLICFLYAVSDEFHQYFVPGRACRLFDVGVDSAGAVLGLLVCIAVLIIKTRKRVRDQI